MGLAVVFSGQGMQHPQMLPWLDERRVADMPGWRKALEDPAWAARNANAQPLLTGLALAAWQDLAPLLPRPEAVAGYSVGELAAFAVAGVFEPSTAQALAVQRAAAMDRCPPGGLVAVTGLAPDAIAALCTTTGCHVAIENGFDTVVLGGPHASLAAMRAQAEVSGAHCTPLRVEVSSHTPAMQPAADAFATLLADLTLRAPTLPLFSNACGERLWNAPQAADALAAQIARTVRWATCMDQIQARRATCVLEIGPGGALARLWNQRHPGVQARSVDEFRSVAAVADWVARQIG
ncbi:acyltransferase domain-containing protein [Paucibacter sp. R3-3]|uniref:Acyltransferase domain-containing protein n=1 Tax=Roseateles agri TaxID=3098619 RepID=A0ABU5DLS9_9BURK|nr:acyltransferase domain-containing protein [Paucibacter sp. R3-3]MDY0746673.1 acyltransferase domain-containing protein [Paucibacter sp. R3-3]